MDNRLNLDSEVRELKLGSTFTSPSPRTVFHTIKYDFKPASVDVNKPASLEVGTNKQVTVTVPHLDGSGVPNTVFKGNQRDYTKKECVLIIDRVTGEITLEKLNSNVQVKKTRTESKAVQPPQPPPPQIKVENSTARQSSKTKITTGSRKNTPISFVPKHSPLQNSPSYPNKSPLSAPAWNANNTQQTLPSIPIIGLDDGSDFMTVPSSSLPSVQQQQQQQQSQSMHHGNTAHNTSGGSSSSSGSLNSSSNNHHTSNNVNSSSSNNHKNHSSSSGSSAAAAVHGLGSNSNSHLNPYTNHHGGGGGGGGGGSDNNVEINLPSRAQGSPPRDTGFSTGLLTSSDSDSSGSSDSDSGSDSESTTEDNNDSPVKESIFDIGPTRSDSLNNRSLPTHLLTEDLCLSESNSDSD